MKVNRLTYGEIHRPMYILEEERLRRNLALIQRVASEADVEIILAFKAYALWKTFPIFREYISSTTASSLGEAMLAFHEFGARAHTYSPAYTDYEIDDIARCSSHLTFNSLSQYSRYHEWVREIDSTIQLDFVSTPSIPRWVLPSIILVRQAPGLVLWPTHFLPLFRPISVASIVIAIVRADLMSLSAPWCISRRNSPSGSRRLSGLTSVVAIL